MRGAQIRWSIKRNPQGFAEQQIGRYADALLDDNESLAKVIASIKASGLKPCEDKEGSK